MTNYQPTKTLDEANQFVFVCPIFETQTKIASCFTLRELVWRGNKPDVRKGCQMCMKHSKCPANNIIWDMIRRPDFDPYHSATPKLGKLQDKHLVQIERVIINEKDIERALDAGRISPAEAQKMTRANQLARNQANKGVRSATDFELVDVRPEPVERRVEKIKKDDAEVSATVQAAITGDMTAAVNKAMGEAA